MNHRDTEDTENSQRGSSRNLKFRHLSTVVPLRGDGSSIAGHLRKREIEVPFRGITLRQGTWDYIEMFKRMVFSGVAWILSALLLLFPTGEVFAGARRGGKAAAATRADQPPVTKAVVPSASSGVSCLSCPAPEYPIEAAQRGTRGVVGLELTVGEDGRVEAVKVLAAPCDELKEASVKAAQGWTFKPALRDGKPVREVVQVPVVFRLFQSYARLRQIPSSGPSSSPLKAR